LTQVLDDGINVYTYGLGRISQTRDTGTPDTEYFLGDALGSVRQLTAGNGDVTLSRTYAPYGVITAANGTSQTAYGFTGEYHGIYIKLIYLRARFYNPADGRFQSRDTWGGNDFLPITLNKWSYAHGNPITLTDPSGHDPWWCENQNNPDFCYMQWNVDHGGEITADAIESVWWNYPEQTLRMLQQQFNIKIPPGYSFRLASSNSTVFEGHDDVYGFGAWFSSVIEHPGNVLEFSSTSCKRLSFGDLEDAVYLDYGIYITTFTFTGLEFYPDDIAAVMIHEAAHAWQEEGARFNPISQTEDWNIEYKRGKERMADDYVIAADDTGRINMTWSFRNLINRHKRQNRGGEDFPYYMPPGVP
jgi:RHS repeat-associated protein